MEGSSRKRMNSSVCRRYPNAAVVRSPRSCCAEANQAFARSHEGKVAVELVGSERAIAASEDQIGLSKSSVEPGLGRGGTAAIVAIGDKTCGEITVGCDCF